MADTAYCASNDILVGDVSTVSDQVEKHVDMAAEEINSAIGHIYVTPVVGASDHAMLTLKMINVKLATGRYFAAMARGSSSGEGEPNAYAQSLIREAQDQINQIRSGDILLNGAATVGADDAAVDDARNPTVIQADTKSGVNEFYGFVQSAYPGPLVRPITEWDDNR